MKVGVLCETMEVVLLFSEIVSSGFQKKNFAFNFQNVCFDTIKNKIQEKKRKIKKDFFYIF